MKTKLLSFICITGIMAFAGCSPNQSENRGKIELTISAAASLNEVLTEIEKEYEAEHENINLLFNFGGSGSLQQQIVQGAPVDLFFSADENTFEQLMEQGFIDDQHHIALVGNQLALVIPKQSDKKIANFSDLLLDEVNRIGIGIPETVPAGMYAEQTLKSLDLWNKLEGKMIPAKDVRQVLSYVETNNVDAGIVYQTDAVISDKITIAAIADPSWHKPIVYSVGIVDQTVHKEAAIDFYEYLQTETALEHFKKLGFHIVGR